MNFSVLVKKNKKNRGIGRKLRHFSTKSNRIKITRNAAFNLGYSLEI